MTSIASTLSSLLLAASLSGTAFANGAPPAAAKPDLVKGEALANKVCAACHAVDAGRGSPANPLLKAQHPEYLAKQLTEFKNGKRASAVMKGIADPLTEQDIVNVSAFYASKAESFGSATKANSVKLGEKIYRGGIADRQVPACAACHGPAGSGLPSQYPRLRGQHASYTEAQLFAFRSKTRKNNPQMTGVVSKMNDEEIKAVSDYIAGMR
jgi:cytochrome c553